MFVYIRHNAMAVCDKIIQFGPLIHIYTYLSFNLLRQNISLINTIY